MKSKKNRLGRKILGSRKPTIQPLEARVVLAASLGWDGPGLGSAELTYYVANHPSSLTQAQTNQAIETALKAWSSVADITFTPTNRSGLRDSIDFSFSRIDGSGGTLAQAYFPDDVNSSRIAGDVQFDSAENWEVGNGNGNRAFDLVLTAVHEIGHSLGLDHCHSVGSVMESAVSPQSVFVSLSDADRRAILELYDSAIVPENSSIQLSDEGNGESTDSDISDDGSSTSDPEDSETTCGTRTTTLINDLVPDSTVIASLSPDRLIERFDSDASGGLSESELSSRIWQILIDSGADTDSDSALSLAELQTAVTNARQAWFDDKDIDSDGFLTTSEVGDRLWTKFSSADSDSSDSLSFDEFDAWATDRAEQIDAGQSSHTRRGHGHHFRSRSPELWQVAVDSLFERFDSDGDSILTSDELASKTLENLINQNVDGDADGSISRDELATAVATARSNFFEATDEDSDGQLTMEEAGRRVWRRIASADADSSGTVSTDELQAWVPSQVYKGHSSSSSERLVSQRGRRR